MISQIRYVFILAIAFLIFIGFKTPYSNNVFSEGNENLIVHHFPDKIDTLSGQEIIELQDENGLSIWFKRHILKDVCLTGECKMVDLWLVWDGVGNYHGMEIPDNKPLTKTDHSAFTPEDYEKLEILLSDTVSVLKDMVLEDLTGESVAEDLDEVDGYSGATLLSLEHIVVKDAVYTCHTLWHTVYGPTQIKIREIIESRVDHSYLDLLFDSNNPNFINWGIESVKRQPKFHIEFSNKIISLIQSEHTFLSQQAMNYFQSSRMNSEELQMALVSLLPSLKRSQQQVLVWRLSQVEETYFEVVFRLLELFENDVLGIASLNMIFEMLEQEYVQDNRIIEIMEKLKNHENIHIQITIAKKLKNFEMN